METDSTDLWLDDWSGAEAFFGGAQAIDDLAFSTGAMVRRRVVRDGSQLLRLALAYASAGQSCRITSAWSGLALGVDLSNPALIGRLKPSGDFLAALVGQLLARADPGEELAAQWDGPPIRLVDGSMFTSPGAKGVQHRLHAAYDPMRGWFTSFELTSGKIGENLSRADIEKGTVAVGDRNYAKTWALRKLADAEAFYCVRTGVYSTRMLDPLNGEKLACAAIIARLGAQDSAEIPVLLIESRGKKEPPMAARLVIFRPSEACQKREQARIKRTKISHRVTPRSDTWAMAGIVTILTNLPQNLWPIARIMQLYRLRWQIELAFKTLKSTFRMRDTPCKTAPMARMWILANLAAALLAKHLSGTLKGCFSPTAGKLQKAAMPAKDTDVQPPDNPPDPARKSQQPYQNRQKPTAPERLP